MKIEYYDDLNGDWRLYLWLIHKYESLTQPERLYILKGILLYKQFLDHVNEWVTR
jgi:hypothetical protein